MKKLAVLVCLLTTLTGCARDDNGMKAALSLRDRILSGGGCSFSAEITADYGDCLHTFAIHSQSDAKGDLSFRVEAPESIAGIGGSIRQTGGEIVFEETVLAFPLLAEDQLSPISAPWIFMKALRSGCITATCMEGDMLRVTVDDSYAEDAMTLDIWLDSDFIPTCAQILHNGKSILTLSISSFDIQ